MPKRGTKNRSTPLSVAAGLAAAALFLGGPLAAQVTAPSVTVIGIVVDSVSGSPVTAARVSVAGGRGVATDALGRFALSEVPTGSRTLVITRLGYQELDVVVAITDPMGGLRLRISPNP